MSVDTAALNAARHRLADDAPVWLFGYGSLIYKVDFPFVQRTPAAIYGWERRFWQGSEDHRGVPGAPGRVVTLIDSPGSRCGGIAYQVAAGVFRHLDVREKHGYLRLWQALHFADGSTVDGLVYIAGPENPGFLGPAPEPEVAAQVARAVGPSGDNRGYLLQLAAALRELGERDEHVFALEAAVLERQRSVSDG